jgi:PAS domain S-box-containing protein
MTAVLNSSLGRVLVLAPQGRDAEIARAMLKEAGIISEICLDLSAFEQALGDDTCFAVVTEEAIRSSDMRIVASRVNAQPAWSDLPFIILTQRGGDADRNSGASRLSDLLGNATFLERPFHPTTFISVARTALKGRQRQYEARARIELLHEGEERLRTALLAGRLGSWELDTAAGTLTASATCKALFGRTADEDFSYEDLIASIHSDDRKRMQEGVQTSIERGTDYATEYRNVWPDGSIHWAEIRARHVRDRTTGKSRLVGVASDITERKTAEGALKRLNETLEERVAERTTELNQAHAAVLAEIGQREHTEELLRQSQKMEMIGQLTGGVAHDFNNLLMVVLANLTLLGRQQPNDARTTRLIDGALQGAQRGAVLTQRLLAFARRQELKLEPKSLADLVRGMSDLIERSAGSQIEVLLDVPETLPLALVDANQIELALLNLVVNARDAMPSGGVLTIKLDRTQAGAGDELPLGPYVRLTVSDNGEGMDAETLRKATEPFFSTKGLGKGTGLGLSMIHGLANQMNGALRLKSELGQGTTAELWLPVTAVAADIGQTQDVPWVKEADRPSITVLVVDDDALIAMSTVEMLEDLGHEALDAGSPARALEILNNGQHVDLLITDYSMPRMNGVELAKAVRKLRPCLPILMASGYAELPSPSGIDLPRIGKPYQQDQLAAEITKVLGPESPSCVRNSNV